MIIWLKKEKRLRRDQVKSQKEKEDKFSFSVLFFNKIYKFCFLSSFYETSCTPRATKTKNIGK